MSFQLKISGSNTLEISYSGTVTKEELNAVRENAIAMINSNNLTLIFCDLRNVNLDIGSVDIFNFAASKKKMYPIIRRTVILYEKSSNIGKDLNLYVKTANKRGSKVKAFTDLNSCKTWLRAR